MLAEETITASVDKSVGPHARTISILVATDVAPGTYWVVAMLDNGNVIQEPNEQNAVYSAALMTIEP